MKTAVTEEQARTKWCAMVGKRAALTGRDNANCLAAGCMAWRWVANHEGQLGYCGLAGEIKP
jgi:hypothetical protein